MTITDFTADYLDRGATDVPGPGPMAEAAAVTGKAAGVSIVVYLVAAAALWWFFIRKK
jgi:hypothetical protein